MEKRSRVLWVLPIAVALITALPNLAAAAPQAEIAGVAAGGDAVVWQPLDSGYERLVLTVSGPDGVVRRQEFAAGEAPSFSLFDAAGFHLPDGSYTWELQLVRAATRTRTGDETDASLSSASYGLRPAGGGSEGTVQSGSFAVVGGDAVLPGLTEPERDAASVAAPSKAIVAADFAINDDLIVTGSACIGFDCVNGESFGFDTIRMKENNLRIAAVDTSSLSGFPTQDWQLTFNDSASGGQNKFSVDAIAPSTGTPFTIIAGAPSNSLFVSSSGRVGLRTGTPVLDLHIATGNTPGIRLEQNGSSGFAAQTWDIAGNETNFFVRDVTGGSKLPLRIRPNAPTSSIDINGSGDVGVGTSAPAAAVEVKRTGTGAAITFLQLHNSNGPARLEFRDDSASDVDWDFRTTSGDTFVITQPTSPSNDFQIASNGNVTIRGSLTLTTGPCTGCDGVFQPDYPLESIEEHAASMWANSHLPGVGPTLPHQTMDISAKTGGILNELEKAHIYIEQLDLQLKAQAARFQEEKSALEAENAELEMRLETIERALGLATPDP